MSEECFSKDAQPDDRTAYFGLYKKMQDYAQDIQQIEDWKSDLQMRISDLSREDRELIVQAASQ